ncbi:DUF4192 domain-containing protein [Plantactinospora sp. B5E13]|uniref:DUF4192 domain-containing protein n=1 Tax=Plantactinospora sp. B5E13 TaxID=3153758 RepID=UPI00325ED883
MTPTDQATLSVRSTADLLAAVPFLLGFHPADSVVVIALRANRIVFVARGDLPDFLTAPPPSAGGAGEAAARGPGETAARGPGETAARGPGETAGGPGEAAAQLAAVVARQGVETVTIVGYGPPARVTPVIDAVTGALGRFGLPVLDALRVTGDRYWSYVCADPGCCPPEGTRFDASASQFAAAATFAGQVALPDRETLVRQVSPVDGPAREAMRQATRRAESRLQKLLDRAAPADPRGRRALRRAGRSAVRIAMLRHRTGGRLTDDELAWLSLLLVHLPTRDEAWQRTGGEDWQLALWTDVLRRSEPDLVAAPATLLCFAAWRAGQGALASVAVERALEAQPDYSLALLLAETLRAGIPPSTLDGWDAPDRSRQEVLRAR